MARLGHMRVASLLIAVALGGCAIASAPPTPEATDAPTPRATPRATSSATAAPESATDLLDCDGPVSEMGGRADDFGPSGFGDTADEAFEAWRVENFFTIPRDGYELWGRVGDRSVYTYASAGRIKVVVVISPRFNEFVGGEGFTVEELRTCDPAEYGGEVDMGEATTVWTHETTGEILTDIRGPDHCGWQTARMLHVELDGVPVRQYIRDPLGVFHDARLLDTYAEHVEMPSDAAPSGYRTADGRALWFTESDRAAYVVTPEGVERWPRAEELIGCA